MRIGRIRPFFVQSFNCRQRDARTDSKTAARRTGITWASDAAAQPAIGSNARSQTRTDSALKMKWRLNGGPIEHHSARHHGKSSDPKK